LPSLTALRALEAAGRRRSLTGAAQELNVSIGAISRHISLLEAHFGRPLLRRLKSGVEPTPECAEYLRSLALAFDEIDAASNRLAAGDLGRPLRIWFYSTFTTEWLASRLPAFRAAYPDIPLDFTLSTRDARWRDEDFDLALTVNPPAGPEFASTELFETRFALVCAPALQARLAAGTPLDLTGQTLLVAPNEIGFWRDVLAAIDAPPLEEQSCLRFESLSLTYQAARGGGGIALGNLFIIADDLASGRLVLPFEPVFTVELPHLLVSRKSRRSHTPLTTFRNWLISEAAASEAALAPILARHSSRIVKHRVPLARSVPASSRPAPRSSRG